MTNGARLPRNGDWPTGGCIMTQVNHFSVRNFALRFVY
jgi:hypothetical protein